MPNWCECDLTVEGPVEEVKKFMEFARTGDNVLDHNKFVPYPKEFADADAAAAKWREENPDQLWTKGPKDGFNNGGYEWCKNNWGTKWGIDRPKITETFGIEGVGVEYNLKEGSVDYTFECAWSPPTPIIKKMGEQFKKLRFVLRYFEASMAFNGIYILENGKVTEDETGAYYGTRGG